MKKPHVLLGLLAAVGTAIGVLVAIVGLPYGRMSYTAFAGAYHQGTPTPGFSASIDCDASTAAVDSTCTYQFGVTTTFNAAISFDNEGATDDVASFNFKVHDPNTAVISAPAIAATNSGRDGNPDFIDANFLVPANWQGSPAPVNDDASDGAGTNVSVGSYFTSDPTGTPWVTGTEQQTALVKYNVNALGSVTLSLSDVAYTDGVGIELGSCNPTNLQAMPCFNAVVNIVPPPPATATFTPVPATATPVPPTATNTPLGGGVIKVPEGNAANANQSIPAANLFLCVTGPCSGPGEGDLKVIEHAFNVQTGDQNGDTVPDGLGAYEFQVEYDNFVIQSVNPTDIVFHPGGAGASRGLPTCSFSLILENVIRFGCTTTGPTPPGPLGSFDLAQLDLVPHPDLTNDIFPGNDNGVVTVLKDNGCELSDVFGHAVLGSINGGLLPTCGDLAVTVRILEGDLNLDCKVDIQDEQLIAMRYGSFFGSLRYSKWYDLEPNTHDLDIDIKDLQKVFGRDGSTCQNPIPAQPPLGPPAPFGN